jgi:hypothetical protein
MQDKCLIRRIRKGEIEELVRIQSEATEFNKFFHHHKEWFEKAINEIRGNNRIAFGAFRTFIDEKSQSKIDELVCSVIVKKGEYSNELELKNLIFNSKSYERYTSYSSKKIRQVGIDIKKQLIDKVASFCERRGYESLETEIPSIFDDDISILISCGFKVLSIREKYGEGKYVNVLEKRLGQIYQGDPFDLNKMIEWAAKHYFPFKQNNYREAYFFNDTSLLISSLHFSISPKYTQTQLLSQSEKDLVTIEGEFTIDLFNDNLDTLTKDPTQFFSRKSDLKYLVSNNESIELIEKCNKNKIKLLSTNLLKRILGDDKSSLKIPFNKDDVAGIITLLEPKYLKDFEEFNGEFIYFLLSGLGSSLSYLDDESHILVFYAPLNEYFIGGFWGYAEIESIHSKLYEEAYKYFPEHLGKIISEEDLLFYKTYSENEKVIILRCKNFIPFDKPVDPNTIEDIQLKDYILTELNIENASSVYINWILNYFIKSQKTMSNNTQISNSMKKNTDKKGIDWISFIIETGKGIPQVGGLLFGGLQKIRDDKKNTDKFDALNNKIDLLIEQNKDITKSSLESVFEDYIKNGLREFILCTSTDIINTTINEFKRVGTIPSPEIIIPNLKISTFPLPVDEELFRKEMIQLFGTRNDIKSFRFALDLANYELDIAENEVPKNEVLLFCKSLKGKDLNKLYLIFEEFYKSYPNSTIIVEILKYLRLIYSERK